MDEVIEEISECDEEDKLEKMMDELFQYCQHMNVPLLNHPDTCTYIQKLIAVSTE